MIRSDEENRRWWDGLSRLEKSEAFDLIREAGSEEFADSLQKQFLTARGLSPRQIAAIRKFWDNRN